MNTLTNVLLIGYFLSVIINLICFTWMVIDDYKKEYYYSISELVGCYTISFIPFFNSYTAFLFVFDLVDYYWSKRT